MYGMSRRAAWGCGPDSVCPEVFGSMASQDGPRRVTPGEAWRPLGWCAWRDENSGTRAALILEKYDCADIRTLVGGLDAWRDAGLPVAVK
jgi:hypothetical protein